MNSLRFLTSDTSHQLRERVPALDPYHVFMSGCRPTCDGSVKAVDRSLKPTREVGRSGGLLARPAWAGQTADMSSLDPRAA
jgi:hypothetical protein